VTKTRRPLKFNCFPLDINKTFISIYHFISVGEAVMLSMAFLANLLSLITETVVPVKSAMQK